MGTGYETPKLCETLVALNPPGIDHGTNGVWWFPAAALDERQMSLLAG
jgi:hypothetical protein